MLKGVIEAISSLTPFLDQYPSWVKLLFSAWFILSSSLFLALVLARNKGTVGPVIDPTNNNLGANVSPTTSSSPNINSTSKVSPTPTPPTTQKVRLKIKGVELYGPLGSADNVEVQVTAIVNGTAYKHPSIEGVEWATVGPNMSPQSFTLPVTQSGYEVRFKMLARTRSEQITFVSQDTEIIESLRDLPIAKNYNLYRRDRGTRRPNVEASVKYEVTISSSQ